MTCPPTNVKFQLRRDLSTNWNLSTILQAGEPGFETNTFKLKIGDGTTRWINLPYIGATGATSGPTGPTGPTGENGTFIYAGTTGEVLYFDGTLVTGGTGFVYTPGVSGNITLQGDVIPSVDGIYNLGSTAYRWAEIYVGRGTINIAGPSGSTAVGLIGSDENAIVYTQFGFATPFINVGPAIGTTLAPGSIGGWVIGPTGVLGTTGYDLFAQEALTGITFPAGLTGPQYSLIKHIQPKTIIASGSEGTTGQVLSYNGTTIEWISPPYGPTGPTGENGADGQSSSYFDYQADNGATPSTGHISWSNFAAQTGSTYIRVNHINQDGVDIDIFLNLVQQENSLIIQDKNVSANFQRWLVSGPPIPNTGANYVEYPVTLTSSGGSSNFANNHELILATIVPGPRGPTGPTGPTTAYIFDGGTAGSTYSLGPAFDCGTSF
jgi:hypothetical protein